MWLYLQCGEMGCFHVYSVWREVPWFYFNCRDRGNVFTFTVCGYGGSGYILSVGRDILPCSACCCVHYQQFRYERF